ncbi:MAG: peptidylprolyl isomerase [Phycisphaerae bacterium]|jgi:cyclophilin family peptidyl-prolyl cis-trans isomerase|nr:peptidyl-prolyl cis-trans isomerase [Phycisphaerae bacterium]
MSGFSLFRCVLLSTLLLTLACEQKSSPEGGQPGTGKPAATQKDGSGAASTTPAAAAPAADKQAASPKPADGPPRVEFLVGQDSQDWGRIVIELNPEKAPISSRNFVRYVQEGFYDGTIFHRVMPDFMIQGGGFTSPTEQKLQGLHEPIENESRNGLKNERGTIAMARTGLPHSATSQFFINVKNNPNLDYPSFDGWGYAVFGRVVDGMDVVDRIKEVETRPNPAMDGEKSQPVNPPVIRTARVVK